MPRLSVLPMLCIALATGQSARAAVVGSSASVILSDKIAITATQSLLIGATNISAIRAPVFVTIENAVTQQLSNQVGRGTVQQASFVIVGDNDRSVSIAVPETVALSRLGGEEQLQFDAQSSLAAGQLGQSRLGGSDTGGELAFDVGGRVRLDGDTKAGDYAGVLRVTVQYN